MKRYLADNFDVRTPGDALAFLVCGAITAGLFYLLAWPCAWTGVLP